MTKSLYQTLLSLLQNIKQRDKVTFRIQKIIPRRK